jgi:hypothetical protein
MTYQHTNYEAILKYNKLALRSFFLPFFNLKLDQSYLGSIPQSIFNIFHHLEARELIIVDLETENYSASINK